MEKKRNPILSTTFKQEFMTFGIMVPAVVGFLYLYYPVIRNNFLVFFLCIAPITVILISSALIVRFKIARPLTRLIQNNYKVPEKTSAVKLVRSAKKLVYYDCYSVIVRWFLIGNLALFAFSFFVDIPSSLYKVNFLFLTCGFMEGPLFYLLSDSEIHNIFQKINRDSLESLSLKKLGVVQKIAFSILFLVGNLLTAFSYILIMILENSSNLKLILTSTAVLITIEVLFTGILIYVLSINIRHNLRGVIELSQNMSKGEGDLRKRLMDVEDNELGKISYYLNIFFDTLQHLILELKNAIDGTESIGLNVTNTTNESSRAIEEISTNLNSINEQIGILDTNIDSTVQVIQEVTGNTANMDNQIIDQSSMVEESSAAINQMIASLKSVNTVAQNKMETTQALSDVAGEGKQKMEATARNFNLLTGQISQIQEMVSAISSIAAQTNLLSMNAAIEAAHAGDSGKGFAVVAEEIRKLADSAGHSSKSIAQIIKEITASVSETDKNVSDTSNAFEKISLEVNDTVNAFSEIVQSVQELNTGGVQILESTNHINDVTISIRSGSSDIKQGTVLMQENSVRIKEVSQRVTKGMSESTLRAQEIVTAMQLMVSNADDLKGIIQRLKDDFSMFKV